jgi:hypothetical protein
VTQDERIEQDPPLNSAHDDADAGFDNNPVGQPVAACAIRHWISVRLIRQPDLKTRPVWWSVPQAGDTPPR